MSRTKPGLKMVFILKKLVFIMKELVFVLEKNWFLFWKKTGFYSK